MSSYNLPKNINTATSLFLDKSDNNFLYNTINKIFNLDPDIDELVFMNIFSEDYKDLSNFQTFNCANKTAFLLVSHKLAIDYWCIPYLFSYALEVYNTEINQNQKNIEKISCQSILNSSQVILLIQPDYSTIWNFRKKIFSKKILIEETKIDLLYTEIKMIHMILTKSPKSNETWNHYRYIISLIFQLNPFNLSVIINHIQKQKHIQIQKSNFTSFISYLFNQIDIIIKIYPKNYLAWNFRLWILSQVAKKITDEQTMLNILTIDFEKITKYSQKNISDHSVFSYRQYLFEIFFKKKIIFEKNNKNYHLVNITHSKIFRNIKNITITKTNDFSPYSSLLDFFYVEFGFIINLIRFYPSHESLWYHRRWIFSLFIEYFFNLVKKKEKETEDLLKFNLILDSLYSFYKDEIDNIQQSQSSELDDIHFLSKYQIIAEKNNSNKYILYISDRIKELFIYIHSVLILIKCKHCKKIYEDSDSSLDTLQKSKNILIEIRKNKFRVTTLLFNLSPMQSEQWKQKNKN